MRPSLNRRTGRPGTLLVPASLLLAACGETATTQAPKGIASIAAVPVRTAHTKLGTVAYRVFGSGPPLARVLFLGVLVAVLVSGCGAGSTASRLQSRLLSVADLPAGWSSVAVAASPVKVTSTPCFAHLAENPKGWSYQAAAFVEGKSIPNVGEVLATGARVQQVWDRFERALASCRSAMLQLGNTTVEATVRRLAFPRLGRTSSAYAWAFSLAGIRLGFDLVLFRTSRYEGYLAFANLGQPATVTVDAFARAAVAKAQSGATAPVADGVSIASVPVRTAHTRLGTVGYRAIGTGPPLLLITGYGGTIDSWAPQFVDALAQHHHVITLDNAGIGKSSKLPAPLTIDAMADQTSALINALGLGRTDVLGWSMGSMIAQALTILHPSQVHRLVLCAGFPGNGTTVQPSRQELNAFEGGDEQKVMAALFPADQSAAQNTYLAAISSYPASPSPPADVLAAQRRAVDVWWNGTDPAGTKTATITAPTLIADGTLDRLDPAANSQTLAKLIHRAELLLYPDAGHAFLFQDQTNLVPRLESFLR
jgi:pimeloyl-ACP methyl ester carboxylesterase